MPINILAEPPQIPTQPSAVASVPSSFTPPVGPPPSRVPLSDTPNLLMLNGPSDPPLWKPFFNEQGLASPAFIELLSAVFKQLDPNNIGVLIPEAVSEFWSVMGKTGNTNPCKP